MPLQDACDQYISVWNCILHAYKSFTMGDNMGNQGGARLHTRVTALGTVEVAVTPERPINYVRNQIPLDKVTVKSL